MFRSSLENLLSRIPGSLRRSDFQLNLQAGLLLRRKVSSFATLDPKLLSGKFPAQVHNLVHGEWSMPENVWECPDPLNGEPFLKVADTQPAELEPFIASLRSCPKSGLHNPYKNPERYNLYGEISASTAAALKHEKVAAFFAKLIQRVSPKSYPQAAAEVRVTQKFFENFSGDQVRFLARSFSVSGDHTGQRSSGHRWPYGPVSRNSQAKNDIWRSSATSLLPCQVAVIGPFNFPLEIPALQLMGALFMGNKPVLKMDSKVSVVMEQFLRLLHQCGLPRHDVDFINSDGPTMNHLLLKAQPQVTQFTGSSHVAEKLAVDLKGLVRLEDAGFDWKILGPDVADVEYVAWTSDQDAYACSGQKCSAQSILFMHQNWVEAGLEERLRALAARRKLEDLTIGPVLTWSTERIQSHVDRLLALPGARLSIGGKPLSNHSIPPVYGAYEPTAVFVPLESILQDEQTFQVATTELFGPVQVLTAYTSEQLPLVLEACERMHAHLTAAVVSNDPRFLQTVLGSTVNGTTYVGMRARTTGAPQNHWFGPAGDPRGAGIGTPEAIRMVWSCHREVIDDVGPIPPTWTTPQAT